MNNQKQKKKMPKAVKIILNTLSTIGIVLLAVLMILVGVCLAVFRGPSESARDLAIKSLDETSAMKWVSSLFLPRDIIDNVLNPKASSDGTDDGGNDVIIEPNFTTNAKLINVTIDIGISLRIDLRQNMTVKNISISDKLDGFNLEELEDKTFEQTCGIFLDSLKKSNLITEGKNDALLIGTVAHNDDISNEINDTISRIIAEKQLPISVLSLYTLSKDNGLDTLASNLNLSYNKIKLCNLISPDDHAKFYYLSMLNLTEILSYCEKNGIDIKTLVNNANVKEQELIPPDTSSDEDEWKDYPDGIKIIPVKGETFNGRVMIIKDPSKVYTATSTNSYDRNKAGIGIDKKIVSEGAVAAINGGFFVDYAKYQGEYVYNGSIPYGTVMSNGKHIFTNNTGIYKGFVGFTKDDQLIVFNRFITKDDIEKYDIRDGVCCAPVLIQNGEPIDYDDFGEAESLNPRTAIGQRADGAVIFLTIDGRLPNSLGASCQDIIDVMLEFGAVTAANLDGGASSAMYYLDNYGRYGDKGKYVLMNSRSVLYDPRGIPTYFMVKP